MTRSPLNKVSKSPHRRAARFVPAANLKAVKERSGGQCEVVKVLLNTREVLQVHPNHKLVLPIGVFVTYHERCPNEAMRQPHHLLKRSRSTIAERHLVNNLLDACCLHHTHAERNETESVKYGLSIPYSGYKL
jgi:hypothetical protein